MNTKLLHEKLSGAYLYPRVIMVLEGALHITKGEK